MAKYIKLSDAVELPRSAQHAREFVAFIKSNCGDGGRSMTPEEIVKALRCTATVQTGDEPCASCPFCQVEMLTEAQKAQLHCEEWRGCDVDGVALAAADLIERLEKEEETGCLF